MEWPFGSARARQFGLSILFLLLLAQPSYTQPFPESSRQKAEQERKKQETKGTDEAYKALMKRTTPDAKKEVDPWGNLRTPSAGK
jgi:hypothetical protein